MCGMKQIGLKRMGRLGILLLTLALVAVLSCALISPTASTPDMAERRMDNQPACEQLSLETDNAMRLRLAQLLNLNRAFDDCLLSPAALIDEASVILLDQAETIDGNRVLPMGKVLAFLSDLYGVQPELDDLPAAYTATAPGYFDIIPRGYDAMDSELIEAQPQPDGSIKATAKLTVTAHDGSVCVLDTETVFVPSSTSAFGYIIQSAVILSGADEAADSFNLQNPMDLIDSGYDRVSIN